MSETSGIKIDNNHKKNLAMKASLIVVLISFALSIIDMGLISSCDYSNSSLWRELIAFILDCFCALVILAGIIACSVMYAKEKIGVSILVVNIILFAIWLFSASFSFASILCILGHNAGMGPKYEYVDISQYHFNFIYFEHYVATLEFETLETYLIFDLSFPYINFIGNLIITAIVIPLYVIEYAKHKSENKTE